LNEMLEHEPAMQRVFGSELVGTRLPRQNSHLWEGTAAVCTVAVICGERLLQSKSQRVSSLSALKEPAQNAHICPRTTCSTLHSARIIVTRSPAQPCNRASWRRSWRSSWDTRLEWLGHLRLPCPLRPCLIKGGHDMCTRVPDVDALALKPWEQSGVHHWENLGAKWAGVICRSRDGAKDERCARASANEVERLRGMADKIKRYLPTL
jgi:hypothetical protein